MGLVTVETVADFLGIKPDTAYRWASAGYLPCIRLGRGTHRRALRFNLREVEEWAAAQTAAGRTERVPHLEA